MNISEQEIEAVLRCAPQPEPPKGLKNQLVAELNQSVTPLEPKTSRTAYLPGPWFRRWWPIIVPATASLVCVAVMAVQQMEIRGLKDSVRILSQTAPSEARPTASEPTPEFTSAPDLAAAEQEEIKRLKERVLQLTEEIVHLEQIRTENANLHQQLAAPPALTTEELDAVVKAREKAMSIQCINNLKQFGLAVRLWALHNNDVNPPDFVSMSNELNTAKILLCPADTNRPAASNWASFTAANCSYEFLSPSATNAGSLEPMRLLSRCPLHGHIGLCDGSVQGEVARKLPERLVERDGKLYYEQGAQQPAPRPKPPAESSTPKRRY